MCGVSSKANFFGNTRSVRKNADAEYHLQRASETTVRKYGGFLFYKRKVLGGFCGQTNIDFSRLKWYII